MAGPNVDEHDVAGALVGGPLRLSPSLSYGADLLVPADAARVRGRPTAPSAGEPEEGLMPNVVCMDLQQAQDTIQAAGVFFSRSEDATGEGRAQLVDCNWIVVAQTPAPGTPIGEGEAVPAS